MPLFYSRRYRCAKCCVDASGTMAPAFVVLRCAGIRERILPARSKRAGHCRCYARRSFVTPLTTRHRPSMQLAAHFKPWRLLPGYAINGIAVAVGIGAIQLLASAAAGAYAAQLVVSGATCASLADVPNSVSRTWQRVAVAALLSFAAALVVDLLRPHPLALGAGVAAIGFVGMMVMTWGARAGAVAFTPILSMIFSMAVPPTGHELTVAGLSACGGAAYFAWSILSGIALQRRYRTLALVDAVRAAAVLFRTRADVLEAGRARADQTAPLRAWILGEATLADRLQSARDLVFALPESLRWQRDTAILLRVIDLRDLLLASPLDVELLGNDDTARAILAQVAGALREIGVRMDQAADDIRDDSVTGADALPRIDFVARLADVEVAPGDARARLVPALLSRQQRMADDVARVHRLLQGGDEPLPLTRAQLQHFVSPEGWPLRACQRQGLVATLQQPMHARDVVGHALLSRKQRGDKARARVAGCDLDVGEPRDKIDARQRVRTGHGVVADIIGRLVHAHTDFTQRAGNLRENRARGIVVAEELHVERTRQQQVAQVDDPQQDGGVALPAQGFGKREHEVACGLKAVGERGLAEDLRAQWRGLVRARASRFQHIGPRAKQRSRSALVDAVRAA